MKYLSYGLFVFFVFVIGIIPFRLLYMFSDFMCFVLSGVFKYRRKVILDNLNRVFPEMSASRKRELMKDFYRHLTDLLIEGIKSFRMTEAQINKRHIIINPELVERFHQEGRSMIIVAAHYANWEWGSLSASLQTNFNVVGLYKPLSNPFVDRFLRNSRFRFGTTLASIYETSLTFDKYRNIPTIYLMAADQSPSKRERNKALWIDFLGVRTAFLRGPEKHARNNDLPVVYVDIQRVKRGHYVMELEVLAENTADLAEGEITGRYAGKLESIIRKNPANWLWSHRRWKLNSQAFSL
nr:lysophospholipid acyltransferase family protein [Bacteroidota bacterium]